MAEFLSEKTDLREQAIQYIMQIYGCNKQTALNFYIDEVEEAYHSIKLQENNIL